MLIQVLGDLEVRVGGVELPLGGLKPRTLVGLLVAARGRPVSTERLIDQLWAEAPPPKVLTAVQAYVAKLRRQFEPDREPRAPSSVLVTRPSGYALVLPDEAVDAHRFESLLTRAASAEPTESETLLVGALDLWRGPAYAELLDAPVLAAESRRLSDLRLGAVERLWDRRLDLGAEDAAVSALRALTGEHPERERLWALLVTALYRSGRQAESLDALRDVRAHLADAFGLDPGPELRRLEVAVLQQDDGVLRPTGGSPGGDRAVVGRPVAALPEDVSPAAGTTPAPAPAGREELLDRLAPLVTGASSGAGRVLLVTGPAGIGKTRVAEALAAVAERAGLRTRWGTWEAEGCPPLWAWRQAVGAEVPGLTAAVGGEDDTASATFRLGEEVLETLTAGGGSCLVLDDVQWADADSLRLLGRVTDQVADAPVLVVVLCREPVPDAGTALQALLASLTRAGAERVALPGLSAGAVRALVEQHTGITVALPVAERIRQRTDGNPFYVHELVRLLVEEGALSDLDGPAWARVPHGVRDTVRHRLGDLGPEVRAAVSVAAVLGRTVDLDVLESCWDGDPVTLDAGIDSALAAGFLTEDATGRIRFPHALVRDAVYAELPPFTRRRMHARAAAVLERLHPGDVDEHAATLAEHYRLAGPTHARSAWIFAVRAARAASASGAHADAARLLAEAAAAQSQDPLAGPEEQEALGVARGAALRRSGRIAEAWPSLRSAAESALGRGDGRAAAQALLVVTEQVLWSWRTEHRADEAAVELWQRVIAALPPGAEGLRARCLAALSVEVMHDPPGGRCGRWADEALALARRHEDVAVRIDVLHVVLNPLRRPDLLPRRVPAADELVALCVKHGDERSLAVALCKRALNHSAYARPGAALADLRRAAVMAEKHHLAPALMVVHLARGVLLQAAGQWSEAEDAVRRAEEVQSTLVMAGAGLSSAVRGSALLAQGRHEEAERVLRSVGRTHPALSDLHALALLRARGTDAARALLGPWHEQPAMIWDYLWVSHATLRALIWSELGDEAAVAELRVLLEPYADRVADGAMAALFMGSVRHALAALALSAGDVGAAREHATAARDLHGRLGWLPWERLSQELLDRVPPGDAA